LGQVIQDATFCIHIGEHIGESDSPKLSHFSIITLPIGHMLLSYGTKHKGLMARSTFSSANLIIVAALVLASSYFIGLFNFASSTTCTVLVRDLAMTVFSTTLSWGSIRNISFLVLTAIELNKEEKTQPVSTGHITTFTISNHRIRRQRNHS
jgi:hypothetical protein